MIDPNRGRAQCAVVLLLGLGLIACTPLVRPPGPARLAPQLAHAHFRSADGAILPLRAWLPATEPHAAIVALHGFNDYSRAFEMPGAYFQAHGVACYAYDQRGFGRAPERGVWPGTAAYIRDLEQVLAAVRARHPGKPLYLLGESMGAAIALVTMTQAAPPPIDGLILSAPAVWSRDTMPWYQRALLESTAHTLPWMRLTGEGLHVVASDNIDMLRGLSRDPWVIKATRVDAIYGLVDLMDEAMDHIPRLRVPTLVLIGARDEIIPKEPLQRMLERLPPGLPTRVAHYPQGYHLLLRDLQAATPWRDIVAWVDDRQQALPSGADQAPLRSPEMLAGTNGTSAPPIARTAKP